MFCYDMALKVKRRDMLQANMLDGLSYDDDGAAITEIVSTPFSKEIRIAMQKHQVMRDHESSHPVAFGVLEGSIILKAEEDDMLLRKGDVAAFESGVVHHLEAMEDSVLRLTIFLC